MEGLDVGILKMNEDEVMEITVAPEYGFGDKEEKRPLGTVPPNSTLLYTVELLEVVKVCCWITVCLLPSVVRSKDLCKGLSCKGIR